MDAKHRACNRVRCVHLRTRPQRRFHLVAQATVRHERGERFANRLHVGGHIQPVIGQHRSARAHQWLRVRFLMKVAVIRVRNEHGGNMVRLRFRHAVCTRAAQCQFCSAPRQPHVIQKRKHQRLHARARIGGIQFRGRRRSLGARQVQHLPVCQQLPMLQRKRHHE